METWNWFPIEKKNAPKWNKLRYWWGNNRTGIIRHFKTGPPPPKKKKSKRKTVPFTCPQVLVGRNTSIIHHPRFLFFSVLFCTRDKTGGNNKKKKRTCVRRRPRSVGSGTFCRPCGAWRDGPWTSCAWRVADRSRSGTASRRCAPVSFKNGTNQIYQLSLQFFSGLVLSSQKKKKMNILIYLFVFLEEG